MKELLDRLAVEQYGEFGFSTCSPEEQMEIIETYLKVK